MNKDLKGAEEKFPYYCQTCDYHCQCPAHWKQHCESKKHLNGETALHHGRVVAATQMLARGNDTIREAISVAVATEILADSTLVTLDQQGAQMQASLNRTRETAGEIGRSRQLLDKQHRRAIMIKIVVTTVGGIIVVVIGILIYFLWIH